MLTLQVLGVKVWALAHLLSNGNLADVAVWHFCRAVLEPAARQRDRAQGTVYAAGSAAGTAAAVVGAVAWAGFAFWGHAWLIGVAPLGR
ncbi:MAG: NnrU family protein [Paenacidovorax caeni]